MSMHQELLEQTKRLLAEAPVEGPDLDSKVRQLLRAEYLRQLARYRRVDLVLSKKYEMAFQ